MLIIIFSFSLKCISNYFEFFNPFSFEFPLLLKGIIHIIHISHPHNTQYKLFIPSLTLDFKNKKERAVNNYKKADNSIKDALNFIHKNTP